MINTSNKCSGYEDGKCKHGHEINVNYICKGSPMLEYQKEDCKGLLRQSLMMPICVQEE